LTAFGEPAYCGSPHYLQLLENREVPGFEIQCLELGVSVVDECTTAESVLELKLEGTTLLAVDSDAFTELAGPKLGMCTFGGTESGVLEGTGVVTLTGGVVLNASSEGVEA
jgi:hypothetical protein